jgi:hypothetical protein
MARPKKNPDEKVVFLRNVGVPGILFHRFEDEALEYGRTLSQHLQQIFVERYYSDGPIKSEAERKVSKDIQVRGLAHDMILSYQRRWNKLGSIKVPPAEQEKALKDFASRSGLPIELALKTWNEVYDELFARKKKKPEPPNPQLEEAIGKKIDYLTTGAVGDPLDRRQKISHTAKEDEHVNESIQWQEYERTEQQRAENGSTASEDVPE